MTGARQTERQFGDAVVAYARLCRWLVHRDPTWRATGADPGYPDLTLLRDGRMIFAELKAERGTYGKRQLDWGTAIGEVAIASRYAVRYYVWRPADWPEIERVLR